jgi:hypothetical protein
MNADADKLKNQSIAEYAKIRVGVLSGVLTTMLAINAVGVTVTVGLLDGQFDELEKIAVMLLVFAAASAVVLFFLAKRYLESVTYKFGFIEMVHMDAISRVAKRFFTPFILCLTANIFLALLGGATLIAAFLL